MTRASSSCVAVGNGARCPDMWTVLPELLMMPSCFCNSGVHPGQSCTRSHTCAAVTNLQPNLQSRAFGGLHQTLNSAQALPHFPFQVRGAFWPQGFRILQRKTQSRDEPRVRLAQQAVLGAWSNSVHLWLRLQLDQSRGLPFKSHLAHTSARRFFRQ